MMKLLCLLLPEAFTFFTKNIMMFRRLVFMFVGLLKNFKTDSSFKIHFLILFRFVTKNVSLCLC